MRRSRRCDEAPTPRRTPAELEEYYIDAAKEALGEVLSVKLDVKILGITETDEAVRLDLVEAAVVACPSRASRGEPLDEERRHCESRQG